MKKNLFITVFAVVTYIHCLSAQSIKIGDTVPGFTLHNTDGKMISLQQFGQKKCVVVVFTCNHCPFSKMYEDRIIDLQNKFAKKGVSVLAINPNDAAYNDEDSFENMVKRSKEKKYNFPYLHDESQEVARMFGAIRTPHFFVLSVREGAFTLAYEGAMDDNAQDATGVTNRYVERVIEAILNNKTIPYRNVKAIGCSIKWKS